jgi:hypothetical protein
MLMLLFGQSSAPKARLDTAMATRPAATNFFMVPSLKKTVDLTAH